VLLLMVVAASLPLRSQDDDQRQNDQQLGAVTRTFAIRNARIVQAPGRVIEHGTVVVRNGLIVAVGTNVTIPFDARIIEGDSLTVYAGFIDGLSHVAVPKPADVPPQSVPRPGDPPNDRAGIQPERDVRTLLKPDDNSVDSLRRIGFTVAHTVPWGQMLPGSGAVVMLAGTSPGEMVLRGGSSLYARFEPARGDVYPVTPMGIMAKWRNLYHEAERRERIGSFFSEDPSGIERPKYDPSLSAFYPVIDHKMPVLFQTESALEARRAMKLSKELNFPLVIGGLKEGWGITPELRSGNLPLFVSLDLPKKKEAKPADTSSIASRDSLAARIEDTTHAVTPAGHNSFFISDERILTYKDVFTERKQLESRQSEMRMQFESNAALLHRDGVRFGFSTVGASAGQLRENLRLMIRAGLPEDAALAALTTDGAKMLGMEKILGTIDNGKIANMVLTDGPYFEAKSQVRYVFVDGQMFEYEAKKEAGKDTAAADTSMRLTMLDTTRVARLFARATRQPKTLLIRNGTVLTVTKGTLEQTDILVENGKISRIGRGLQAPRGADTIDATGKYVMPGIIDAHSHIAVSGEVNEWTNPVTAEVAIRDVLDPFDISIYRALAGGKTIAHVMHGSANAIGGQCQTIKMRYGVTDPQDLVMEGAPRTIKFALGENPTRVHGRTFHVQPATRMGVEMVIREAFTEAKRYMEAKERYERERKSNSRAIPPAYDLRLETLADILKGDIIVNCHSYRADEILMLMRVFRDFGIKRLVFQHVNEGFKVAPELAAFGAGASVFADWWAYKFEVYYSTAYNAAILTRNGVTTSINSDSPELDRHLYHEAAKTQKYGGLSRDEALALITINPARQLGIEDRVGSIEVGKDADLAIFSAHPLSIYAICQKTIVDGVVRFDRDSDPDDMRLDVDPKRPVETATVWHGDVDQCMHGTEHLFRGTTGK
jgi:imidazolonepropionase-like amidohydrolase